MIDLFFIINIHYIEYILRIFHVFWFWLTGQEGFSEEEMEKLPMDLQYLDNNHKREQDPDIRRMLLESLYQVCIVKK